ncbi:hypothetical protein MMC30_002885 [Trapelia coarctata]|nr:hypothetical protein [Trapelia coarctata]
MDSTLFLDRQSMIVLAAGITVCYTIYIGIRRLYFSPVSNFPGPKLAAITWWYEFYYEVVLHGQFYKEIDRMHVIYGPIVRINPTEVHVKDPDWYDELYTSAARPRDKSSWYIGRIGGGSVFGTVPHNHHRLRRSAFNHMFSKGSIEAIGSMIQEKVDTLCKAVEGHISSGEPLRLDLGYIALTIDMISEYAFGESFKLLEKPGFSQEWKDAIYAQFESAIPLRHFPWIANLILLLPDWVASKINKPTAAFVANQETVRKLVRGVLQRKGSSKSDRRSILEEIRDSDLPPSEKEVQRLTDEGVILLGAGSETTAQTLSVLTYHLLDNPDILRRLKDELVQAMPDPSISLPWHKLEQLPFLRAVIKEGHRIAAVITTRLIRSAPNEVLKYREWEIPAGTPISMSQHFMHLDPTIFASPMTFNPSRWLGEENANGRLEKYLIPFSKGSRGCVALNLATAELYQTLASLIRRFDLELYETGWEDVEITWDNFTGGQRKGNQGVRVRVLRKED